MRKPFQGVFLRHNSCFSLLLAGGTGSRFAHTVPKQYHLLPSGVSVVRQAIQTLIHHPSIHGVFAVVHKETEKLFEEATQGLPLLGVTYGGATRQESVRLGLDLMAPHQPEWVLVHDGARPFLSQGLIQRVLDGLMLENAVVPGIPVTDTIKRIENDYVTETVDRTQLVRVQTPQGFYFSTLNDLHQKYRGMNFSDDAGLFEAANLPVLCVAGDEKNIKITKPGDLI
jgi:2-C-methyl-D-erythritol 4-phosphate cytidylyltransferase/2-C-methyl-D-erythritol 2,4-cyclodiphosphate synthase